MSGKKDNQNEYPKNDFSRREEEILKFWDQSETFKQSVEKEAPAGDYVFYDGPPFGTGDPHYGHILSSIAKDVVPRYWTMKGFRVERRWGWDCHGLPIENIIEKDMGISGKKQIEKIGIDKFNEACRSRVLEYADIWDIMVRRIARWIDFKNSYKTMDADFMESIWWGFKKLWDKNLIYKGRKVLLYCPRCETPISNFEVAMDNSYKEITEPSLYAKFKIEYQKGKTGRGVGAIIKNNKGEVLLIKRNEKNRRITWALPGGKVEENETFRQALDREVKEELGVLVSGAKAVTGQPDILEGRLFETICYETEISGTPKVMLPDEHEDIKWFKLDSLPEIDYPPSRDALESYKTGKTKFFITEDINRPLVNVYIVAWTTTPWTLPGNVALAVGPEIKYTMVKAGEEYFILASERLEEVMDGLDYELIKEIKAKDLAGLKYEPLFDVPAIADSGKKVHFVVEADFVATDEGSGVVHTAVVYGEDDYNLGQKFDMPIIPALDEKGYFNETVLQFQGIYFKKADKKITADLKQRGLLLKIKDYPHSYPFCHRCDTQLFYNAIPAWFLSIDKIRDKLIEQNKNINWYPDHLKEGRFKLGIEQAPDWNISRNRYFATPMPIWECDKCNDKTIIGSIAELEEASGQKDIKDIHSHFIDNLSWPCDKCGGQMHRIKEVFDCWVESGSMSFAQHHYMGKPIGGFDPVKKKNFPAQYISEYISQTRAWFYVMHVMSVALYGSNSFENVVTTGVILNEKGEKMSKSKKNFPDPWKVINEFGVDALRMYLMGSSVMHAENLFFNERELRDAFRKNSMILWNVYKFYTMFAQGAKHTAPNKRLESGNILDKWIIVRLNQFISEVTSYMDSYDLPRACRPITDFINELSTWYVRRSRDRFKGKDKKDKKQALDTLAYTLLELSKAIAPFMPFLAEEIWQGVSGNRYQYKEKSVHLEDWPSFVKDKDGKTRKILSDMEIVRKIVELALAKRDEIGIKVRQPLQELRIDNKELKIENSLIELIKDEVNVKEVEVLNHSESIIVKLDANITPELEEEGLKREIVRSINALRKAAKLTIQDQVPIYWEGDKIIEKVMERFKEDITRETLASELKRGLSSVDNQKEVKLNGQTAIFGV